MIYESINLYKNNEIDEFDDNDEENGDEFKYENLNNIILETLTNSNTRKRFIKMENTLINNLKKIIQQKQSPSFNFTINKKKITLDNWNLIFIYNILKGIVFYIFYFFNILKGIILYFWILDTFKNYFQFHLLSNRNFNDFFDCKLEFLYSNDSNNEDVENNNYKNDKRSEKNKYIDNKRKEKRRNFGNYVNNSTFENE
jgi:hypothetical protein